MSGTKHVKTELMVIVCTMLVGAVACGSPMPSSVVPPGNPTEGAVEQTQAPAPAKTEPDQTQPAEQSPTDVAPDAEPVVLNTCNLLTPEDVQMVLGETPGGTYDPYFATCSYTAAGGQQLIVVAYQGEIARARTNEGMQLALQYFGNPTAQQLYDNVEPQLGAMTITEMVKAFAAVDEALGREVTPHPELGDASYLVWIGGRSLQLGVVRGETMTSVVTMNMDRAAAEPAIMLLTETVWSRLPARFTPAP